MSSSRGAAGAHRIGPARSGRHSFLYAFLATLTLAGVVALICSAAVHAGQANSDGASLVLEGHAIAHGHFLLGGWALSLDSFWTSEAPVYAVLDLVAGLHPIELYLGPTIIAALIVVVGFMIARDGHPGSAGLAGGMTVLAIVGFPTFSLLLFFVRGGLHMGATLLALIAFYGLRRGRLGPGMLVAVVALSVGMLGDLETAAYGTAPVFVVGIIGILRCRSRRGGAVSIATAVLASGIALLVHFVATQVGTFSIGSANPIAKHHQIKENIKHSYHLLAALLGIDSHVFGRGGMPGWIEDLHVVTAVVIVLSLAIVSLRLVTGVVLGTGARRVGESFSARRPTRWWDSEPSGWRLDDFLLLACVGVWVSYLGLAFFNTTSFARYLTGAVVFAAVLAGRVVARTWSHTSIPGLRPVVAVAGLAVTVAFAVGLGTLSSTHNPEPAATLSAWLESHRLTNGVGSYWSASITTVQSQGRAAVRPVIANPAGRLVRYDRESDAAWYAGQRFQFFVVNLDIPVGGVTPAAAAATWGPPERTTTVGEYQVLVWRHPFTVSSTGGSGS